jgi:phosphoglycolate phosphatase-like HAD superfamily hydrolase
VSAALRRLQAAGARIGVFTDAPEQLAHVALAQLGAARRIDALESGERAQERLLETLGAGTLVVRTRAELVALDSR